MEPTVSAGPVALMAVIHGHNRLASFLEAMSNASSLVNGCHSFGKVVYGDLIRMDPRSRRPPVVDGSLRPVWNARVDAMDR